MAKISLENLPDEAVNSNRDSTGNNSQVSFFNLKDGEEATVRILIDTYEDFDIHAVHKVPMQGFQYGRAMNCLRGAYDPMEMCPLCAADKALDHRLYLHLIQYVVEGDKIVGKAKVWERSVRDGKFGVNALKNYLNAYGPMSEMVCKIVRTGTGLNTEYTLMPALNPAVYRPDLYVKDTSAFNNWSPLGVAILNKTAEEYTTFLATGNFPQTQQNNNQATPRTYTPNTAPATGMPSTAAPQFVPGITTTPHYEPVTPQYTAPVTPNVTPATITEAPVTPTYQPTTAPQAFGAPEANPAFGGATPRTMPWNNVPNNNEVTTGGFERPRRY